MEAAEKEEFCHNCSASARRYACFVIGPVFQNPMLRSFTLADIMNLGICQYVNTQ